MKNIKELIYTLIAVIIFWVVIFGMAILRGAFN